MRTRHLNRWIMLLLAALMVLSIALGRQAYRIAHTQDAVTSAILQDYAQLIADNYARAMQSRIGFERIYQLVTEMGTAGLLRTGAEAWSAEHANRLAQEKTGLPLRAALSFSVATGNMTTLFGQPGNAADQINQLLAGTGGDFPHLFHILHWPDDGQMQMLVLVSATDSADLIGLLLEPQAVLSLIEAVHANVTLLPPALADSDAIRPFVHLQVKDPADNIAFTTPDYRYNNTTASLVIGTDYAGLFADYSIDATIGRQAVGLLAFGPQSRNDLLVVGIMLLLTLVLGGAALVLLRRERRLMQLRNDFVARVSHELRTPLTQIRMYAESLLFERLPEQSDQDRALQVIQRETTRLGRLVDNILRFSGSNHRHTDVEVEPYSLVKLLRQLQEDFLPMLSASEALMVIECDDVIMTRCHRESLLQILGNLLDNALKYGPAGQTLLLHVSQQNQKVQICLDDQGPGIPARYRERIFEPYFRLDDEQQRAIAGTGIGLSVAAELTGKLGGMLQMQPLDTGGSRFCLSLPPT